MRTTECQIATATKLTRINQLSRTNPAMKFGCLMHHFNAESLRTSFDALDGKKAVGVDGISKTQYSVNLQENLNDLLFRMKRMAYRPAAVRQVLIPKRDKPGQFRPLGISNFEDKIVQGVMKTILESIYEPLFLDNSFGFRPGRSCHDAIKTLRTHLQSTPVDTVIDVDLANFFGTIDHEILLGFLRRKISDERFLRYLTRMFKAGVLAEGELTVQGEGVPQGSLCSPVLSNVMAHHVIDCWVEEMVKPHCRGRVMLVGYCDDLVICCQLHEDAVRIQASLGKRLAKYRLRMNEDKTKLVRFNRARAARGEKQQSFDFLGFTFYMGRSRRGQVLVKLKTSRKRVRSKLRNVKIWIKQVRSYHRLPQIWKVFRQKLQGHIAYYGVSFNLEHVETFLRIATRIVFKWLNRRSQRRSFTWEQFNLFMTANPLPRARVYLQTYSRRRSCLEPIALVGHDGF